MSHTTGAPGLEQLPTLHITESALAGALEQTPLTPAEIVPVFASTNPKGLSAELTETQSGDMQEYVDELAGQSIWSPLAVRDVPAYLHHDILATDGRSCSVISLGLGELSVQAAKRVQAIVAYSFLRTKERRPDLREYWPGLHFVTLDKK